MNKIFRYNPTPYSRFVSSFVLILALLSLLGFSTPSYGDEGNQNSSSENSSSQNSKSFEAIFGHMDMFFGMMRTKYTDHRQRLFYSSPQWGGFLGVNYNYFRKFFSAGILTKFGFWKDRGYPSKFNDPNHYEADESTKLTRPLIPLQFSLTLGVSPFVEKFYFIPKKLITIKAWIGYEYLYGQEQRASGDEDAYVDKVRNSSWVYGVSPWILISFLDQRTANSMYVLNVKSIYISPYLEWTRNLSHREVDYNRKIFGVALTFETL